MNQKVLILDHELVEFVMEWLYRQEQGFHFSLGFLPPDIDSILTLSENDWLLM